ncbi:MAG TPA: DUF503 domain-containing protein [Anaerolineae bacterium]|jgi:uncharacterized protein YlxP (DUF503 family)|nr:DUF503 domain-containing protein [Anaerolineae bacterium]
MLVGLCTLTLDIPHSNSLKDKRQVVKSVIARVRNHFNVSIAEVDANDVWQCAVIGIACVSNDPARAHAVLEKVVQMIGSSRLDAQVADYEIEII